MANSSIGKVISKVWSDPDFKQRLHADPAGTLREHGMDVPEGIEIRVVEDSPSRRTLVIPPAPPALTDEELDTMAGGGWGSTGPSNPSDSQCYSGSPM